VQVPWKRVFMFYFYCFDFFYLFFSASGTSVEIYLQKHNVMLLDVGLNSDAD